MSEDELKVTRRLFLQHSAVASAAAGACSIVLKTDALARADEGVPAVFASGWDGTLPYEYTEGPS